MMQAYELEYQKMHEAKTKGIALAVNKDEDKSYEIENQVRLISRNISKGWSWDNVRVLAINRGV